MPTPLGHSAWVDDLKKTSEETIRASYRLADSWARLATKHGTACRPGCSNCCYLLTTPSLGEAVRLLMAPGSAKIVAGKWAELRILAERFYRRDPEVRSAEWLRQRIPCPFLTAENLCAVYAERPVTCRTHLVKPGEDCSPESEGQWQYDKSEPLLFSNYAGLEFCQRYDLPFMVMPMSVALIWAAKLIASGPAGLRRDLAGTPFSDSLSGALFFAWFETDIRSGGEGEEE